MTRARPTVLVHRRVPRATLLLSLVAVTSAGHVAWAQNKAAADVLFDEGKTLMAAKRFSDACPKFAESQKIDPAPGTLVWLADCYEQNGQTASAWSTYREALAAAKAAHQPAREALATERITALQKILSKVVLKVEEPTAPGLVVTIDGVAVSPSLFGTATPYDPGPHTLGATAPGYEGFSQKFDLARSAQATAVVPPLKRVEAPVVAPSASAAASSSAPPPPPPPAGPTDTARPSEAPHASSPLRPVGIALGGVGAVAVVAAVVVQLGARSQASAAVADCRSHVRCTDADLSKHEGATGRQTLALVVGGLGAGMIVAGGVLLWQAPSASSGRVWLSPAVGPGAASVAVTKSW